MRQARRNQSCFSARQSQPVGRDDLAFPFKSQAYLVRQMAMWSVVSCLRIEHCPANAKVHCAGPRSGLALQDVAMLAIGASALSQMTTSGMTVVASAPSSRFLRRAAAARVAPPCAPAGTWPPTIGVNAMIEMEILAQRKDKVS